MDNQLKAVTILTGFIIIGLCCAGLIVAGPVYLPRLPAQAAEPIPTITPAPTATPKPSPSPAHTGLETIPTDRPTLTPDPNAGLDRYKETVRENLTDMGNALIELGPLMQQPRIGQDDWTIPVAVRFATIQAAHDNLTGTKPPASVEEFHAALINATADCSAATKQFARGVDNLDETMLASAGELIRSCNNKLRVLPSLD